MLEPRSLRIAADVRSAAMRKDTKAPAQPGEPADDRAGISIDETATAAEGTQESLDQHGLLRLLEDALSEARDEIARHEEVEKKLERVRIEAASLAIELNQAQRELEEAQDTLKPETAERIAKLDAELVQTRSELEREKASRKQVERDYDAAALQSGGQLKQLRADAERARAEADRAQTVAEEARADLKKAHEARANHETELADLRRAHEQELAAARQALTREETGRNRDREQLAAIEQLLEAATKRNAAQEKEQPKAPPPPPRAEPPPPRPEPQSPPKDELTSEPITPKGRSKRRKRMFDTRGRTCAVCRRTEAASPGALKSGGWALGAEIDLCPDCQEQGWQLPKGGSLPFRRSSARQESS